MHRLSTVQITHPLDCRGPVTSAHLREWYAIIDGIGFGWFETYKDAATACQEATGLK